MASENYTRKIWEFLGELGWPHDLVADNIIRTKYDGHFDAVKVMIQIRSDRLRLAINPVIIRPAEGWGNSVKRLVESLNSGPQMIDVGFDKEGDMYVKVDPPTKEIEFEQFVYVLFNLCRVSEQLLVPVLQARAYDDFALEKDPKDAA